MKKVNKQCLLDTPRTVRVSEKNLASFSSNQQTGVLKRRFQKNLYKQKQDLSRICANDLKACNLEHLLKSNTQNYSLLKALYVKAYTEKIV